MKHINFYLILLTICFCSCNKPQTSLVILHTNDTHSQVEPKSDGRGGYARRIGYINQERAIDKDLLLLDAGDFCQGTPYFNFYRGDVEVEALNKMKYDAVTLGNHEFDYGVDGLARMLEKAEFPVVCANYDCSQSALKDIVKPYIIVKKKGLKIGIIGVGVQPESLIANDNFAPLVWQNPIPIVNQYADMLKEEKHCDIVIALSHLGTYPSHGDSKDGICDSSLAANSRNIDIIVGGHTHIVVENQYQNNLDGKPVLLCQTGKSGINVGKIIVQLEQ